VTFYIDPIFIMLAEIQKVFQANLMRYAALRELN